MKKRLLLCIVPLLASCTTGSKTKITTNYYSVGETRPYIAQPVIEQPIVQRPIVYQPVYTYQEPTVTDLGKEIGRKIYRKIQTAYYVNP